MIHLSESPHIQWFEPYGKCRCGSRAAGILRGSRNESYGEHCKRCADRRLAASKRVREKECAPRQETRTNQETP